MGLLAPDPAGSLPTSRPYLPVDHTAVVLALAEQQLLAEHLSLLLQAALLLQLLELQVLKQLRLHLQGLGLLQPEETCSGGVGKGSWGDPVLCAAASLALPRDAPGQEN